MAYTMSFDASVKLKKGNPGGLTQHIARDVLEAEGKTLNHSNPNIDKDFTSDNVTLVYDREIGDFRPCKKASEITDAINARLGDVKRPLRKDAVIVRPLILQLDPEWYEDHEDEGERQASYDAMAEWLVGTFGAENLAYLSVHMDEESPHIHAGFVPVTEDGRLSQKDWFPNPSALRAMHDDLRAFMSAKGYDIEKDRKKGQKYVKRLSEAEYRQMMTTLDKADDVNRREQMVRHWNDDVVKKSLALDKREQTISDRESELQRREKALAEREAELDKRADALTAKEQKLDSLIRQGIADGIQSTKQREQKLANSSAQAVKSNSRRRLPSFGLGE